MVQYCSAFGCFNKFKKGGVGFYRLPSKENRRSLWIVALRRKNWKPGAETRICGHHFQTGKPSLEADHPDYVPNVFSYSNITEVTSVRCYERRKSLQMKRRQARVPSANAVPSSDKSQSDQQPPTDEDNINGKPSIETDHPDSVPNVFIDQERTKVTSVKCPQRRKSLQKKRVRVPAANAVPSSDEFQSDQQPSTDQNNINEPKLKAHKMELASLNMEIMALRAEKTKLEEHLKRNSNLNILEDEAKLLFYTGLPNKQMFHCILDIMELSISNSIEVISRKEQLLIVLMKLKLNLLATDLAYRFNISRRTVGRIFELWLEPLSSVLQSVMKNPSKKALKHNSLELEDFSLQEL